MNPFSSSLIVPPLQLFAVLWPLVPLGGLFARELAVTLHAAMWHRRQQPHTLLMPALPVLLLFRPVQAANIYQGSPPVYGAFPTGGPIDGGTSVTIFGSEFDQINRFPSEARCSWGDPREWQQAVFAAQQVRHASRSGLGLG